MDHYADDLAAVIESLDLHDVVLVGHSTGGGEVVRYVGRHGTDRVSKLVLIGAVPPLMLKTVANPMGTPIEAFDQIRSGVLSGPVAVLGGSRTILLRGEPTRLQGLTGPVRLVLAHGACRWASRRRTTASGAFSESDFHDDLDRVDRAEPS